MHCLAGCISESCAAVETAETAMHQLVIISTSMDALQCQTVYNSQHAYQMRAILISCIHAPQEMVGIGYNCAYQTIQSL